MKRALTSLMLTGLIMSICLITSPALATPVQWTTGTGANNHYYDWIAYNATWAQAKADALTKKYNGLPGHLVTITSSDEYNFVKSIADSDAGGWGWLWIGATSVSGTLTWENNETSAWTGYNWKSGSPVAGTYNVKMAGFGNSNQWVTENTNAG